MIQYLNISTPNSLGIALPAEGFVLVGFAQHHLLLASHYAMAYVGEGSTSYADGVNLSHFVGYSTELGHAYPGIQQQEC